MDRYLIEGSNFGSNLTSNLLGYGKIPFYYDYVEQFQIIVKQFLKGLLQKDTFFICCWVNLQNKTQSKQQQKQLNPSQF